MDPKLIPQMVEMWCGVYVSALLVLAVMSYFSSIAILNGLEWLDRRLRPK